MCPPEPVDPSTPRSTAKIQIDDEHRRLNLLLDSLTSTHDLVRVQALLAELSGLLRQHFETEEGPQGLHEVVGDQATHRLPSLQRLIDEHAEILARVERLQQEVADCLDGPVRRTIAGVTALADQLHRHEADEEELFGEAFYSDIGGRGD